MFVKTIKKKLYLCVYWSHLCFFLALVSLVFCTSSVNFFFWRWPIQISTSFKAKTSLTGWPPPWPITPCASTETRRMTSRLGFKFPTHHERGSNSPPPERLWLSNCLRPSLCTAVHRGRLYTGCTRGAVHRGRLYTGYLPRRKAKGSNARGMLLKPRFDQEKHDIFLHIFALNWENSA